MQQVFVESAYLFDAQVLCKLRALWVISSQVK